MSRIIYIKNPSQGSHFRTIGGNKRPPKFPKPPNPHPPAGIPAGTPWVGTGGAIYNNPGSSWFINPPSNGAPNFGSLPSTGIPQYQQPTFDQFIPSQTLWGDLYLILNGVDPFSGDISAPMGTPGTLKFGAGTVWRDFNQEYADAHPGATFSEFYGGIGHPSSKWWGQAKNATKKRPWWAK